MEIIRTRLVALLLCSWLMTSVSFGQDASFDPSYHLRKSSSIIIDKNFYFLAVLSANTQAHELLQRNEALIAYLNGKKRQIQSRVNDNCETCLSLLNDLRYGTDTIKLLNALSDAYDLSKNVFDALIDKELRPSGCYYRFNSQDNKDYFLNCWRETFKGINTIINHYGLGTGYRYPWIDSASYDVNGGYYISYLKDYFSYLGEHIDSMHIFFEPSLAIALELMRANERNEAANYEPLEKRENRKAIEQIKKTSFDKYKYSVILVPGEGPELNGVALDPVGRIRCELAAERWRKKLAPFIVVSGGNVHPFHTGFTEALEMKKYLMETDSIPEWAIILEPRARHTTTNFRNANRLLIRYGIPIDKNALCVSTKDQEDYITDDRFDKRNITELGYLPYRDKKRGSVHEIIFYPVLGCLQIDPIDPLDP